MGSGRPLLRFPMGIPIPRTRLVFLPIDRPLLFPISPPAPCSRSLRDPDRPRCGCRRARRSGCCAAPPPRSPSSTRRRPRRPPASRGPGSSCSLPSRSPRCRCPTASAPVAGWWPARGLMRLWGGSETGRKDPGRRDLHAHLAEVRERLLLRVLSVVLVAVAQVDPTGTLGVVGSLFGEQGPGRVGGDLATLESGDVVLVVRVGDDEVLATGHCDH